MSAAAETNPTTNSWSGVQEADFQHSRGKSGGSKPIEDQGFPCQLSDAWDQVIDVPTLTQRCGGRIDFASRVVASFVSSLDDYDEMLNSCAVPVLSRAAHRVKGAAEQSSATGIANAARTLQDTIDRERPNLEIVLALHSLRDEIVALRKLV